MSNPKGRTLPDIFSIYFAIIAVYCLDIFIFKSDLTVLGEAFYSSALGVLVMFLYVQASKAKLSLIGVSKSTQKLFAGLWQGALISLVPFFAVFAAECVCHGTADVQFMPPSLNYVPIDGNLPPVVIVLIYIVTAFIAVLFKELFFRGLMLKQFKKTAIFAKANAVQALLYALFAVCLAARNAIGGYAEKSDLKILLITAVVFVAYEFIAAVKWGLITRVSGATYIAIADHFLFKFLTSSVFVYEREAALYGALRAAAIQLISFILVLVYYKLTMKKIEAEKLARQNAKELARKEKGEQKAQAKPEINAETISPSDFKSMSGTKKLSDDEILQGEKHLKSALTASADDKKLTNDEIDTLLKDLNGKLSHRHHHSKKESTKITEDFDADKFLQSYKKHGKHKHHHHHHRSEHKVEAVPTPKKSAPKPQPKKTLWQKIKSTGAVDASSSNELL